MRISIYKENDFTNFFIELSKTDCEELIKFLGEGSSTMGISRVRFYDFTESNKPINGRSLVRLTKP